MIKLIGGIAHQGYRCVGRSGGCVPQGKHTRPPTPWVYVCWVERDRGGYTRHCSHTGGTLHWRGHIVVTHTHTHTHAHTHAHTHTSFLSLPYEQSAVNERDGSNVVVVEGQ